MQFGEGRIETMIGLIDGPIAIDHPDLSHANFREIPGRQGGHCTRASSPACMHGTFIAGIFSGRRGSETPSISPGCTLLVRPIFAETLLALEEMPSASPEELATAIVDCVSAGAHFINLSVALERSSKSELCLEEALDYSAKRSVIVVAAAGNQGTIGSSAITRHPWVIPVVACDLRGRPIYDSNFGNSIGRRGLSAPGYRITSVGTDGKPPTFSGTSVAAPFVTGTFALLKSMFPSATAADLKISVTRTTALRRSTVVPPLLDACAAYQFLAAIYGHPRTS